MAQVVYAAPNPYSSQGDTPYPKNDFSSGVVNNGNLILKRMEATGILYTVGQGKRFYVSGIYLQWTRFNTSVANIGRIYVAINSTPIFDMIVPQVIYTADHIEMLFTLPMHLRSGDTVNVNESGGIGADLLITTTVIGYEIQQTEIPNFL